MMAIVDEHAFRTEVDPYVAELHRHCYRMLGSAHDAEDALQETLLKAWRGRPGFGSRSSLRTWLFRIATNTCLNMIERHPKRVLHIDGTPAGGPDTQPGAPLSESVWLGPLPDADVIASTAQVPERRYEEKEAVELAFVAALQHLTGRQRATLVLREVLGFSGAEVAELLETNADSVYSLLQRAHAAIDSKLPVMSQQEVARSLGDDRLRALAERYVAAWEDGDADALAALLAEDAVLTMPPRPTWFQGRDAIRDFIARRPMERGRRWRLEQTACNGQLAFTSHSDEGTHLQVLTLRPDGTVGEITTFLGS